MSDSVDTLAQLASLVVKRGVSIGGLSDEQRQAALSLAWAALPAEPMNERGVNEALKAALAGPAACLATDHVELRRWLVDAGWLARDGFGREYRRVAPQAVPAHNQGWVAVWAHRPVAEWVAQQRAQHAAQRAQRRQAWQDQAAA